MPARIVLFHGVTLDGYIAMLPLLLGDGISVYERIGRRTRLRLAGTTTYGRGIINVAYDVDREPELG